MREVPALRSQISDSKASQISDLRCESPQLSNPSSQLSKVSKKIPIPRSIHVKNDRFLGGGSVSGSPSSLPPWPNRLVLLTFG